MKITFHGAAKTVTGSQHLIQVNGTQILLDCGLYQGRRKEAIQRNQNLPFDPKSVDVVVLSHAHIDHSGNIPNLVKRGYHGDIICTHATRDLCASMLLDSGHIQERNAAFANKHRKKGEPEAVPVYTQEDARRSLECFTSQAYYRTRQIAPDVYLTLHDAGHMLGSAIVVLDVIDAGTRRRVVFSGDIGREGIPIIRDPDGPQQPDILIMESTYGNRLHEPYPDAEAHLKRVINETVARGGSVVMPAFAVGRTQQLVLQLNELIERGEIPEIPIFVDSPLATNVTEAFRAHPEVYDKEIEAFIRQSGDPDPFGFECLTYTRSVEESKALNSREDSIVIISASGMIEFGRVVHHLKQRIDDPRSTVLITGWQAPHTLGRKLIDGAEFVRIFGHEHKNRIQIEVINGFSGHADRDELLQWVDGSHPQRTFLVHGEEDAANSLASNLHERFNLRVDVPELDESFEV